jgi:hypothetical protein
MTLDLADVDADRRAAVAVDHVIADRQQFHREHRRARALTAREALAALRFEALLVWVAASSLRSGIELSEDDHQRLTVACSRIELLADEAS